MTNQQHVLATLQLAVSTTTETRQQAEKQLLEWRNQPSFCETLVNLATTVPDAQTRTLAVIYLKHTVHSHWNVRRAGQTGIPDHEKARVRQFTLGVLRTDPSRLVVEQAKLIAAKVARSDWPSKWPALFDDLVKIITHADTDVTGLVYVFRGVDMLYAVLKELRSKRAPADRRRFQQLADQMLPGIVTLWSDKLAKLLAGLTNRAAGARLDIQVPVLAEVLLKCTKVAHTFIEYGSDAQMADSPHVQSFLESAAQLLQQLRDTRPLVGLEFTWPRQDDTAPFEEQFVASVIKREFHYPVDKVLQVIMRTIVKAQKAHAVGFVRFLGPLLDIALSQISVVQDDKDCSIYANSKDWFARTGYREPVTVHAIEFVANVLGCQEYSASASDSNNNNDDADAQKRAAQQQARAVIESVFTADRVCHLCNTMLTHLMVLQVQDLEAWASDPEQFTMEQASYTASEHIRPAAENLLLTCLDSHGQVVEAFLVERLSQHEQLLPPATLLHLTACSTCASGVTTTQGASSCAGCNTPSPGRGALVAAHHVLLRDTNYLALGLCAFQLSGKIPFTELMQRSFIPILQEISSATSESWAHKILQRRVLWTIGCWVADLTNDLRPPLYAATVGVLGMQGADLVVRLSAVATMDSLIQDWECDVNALANVQQGAVVAVFSLVSELESNDARQKLIALLVELIKRLGSKVRGSLSHYVSHIPALWGFQQQDDPQRESSADVGLTRAAIVDLLSSLVVAATDGLGDPVETAQITSVLQPVVLPILAYSTDPSQPEFLYLSDSAEKLWLALVKSSPQPSEELGQLFARIPELVQRSVGRNKVHLGLIQAYVLLFGEKMGEEQLCQARDALLFMLKEGGTRGVVHLTYAVELIMLQYPGHAGQVLGPVLREMLHRCIGSALYKKGRNQQDYVDPDLVVVGYLTVLAKYLCQDQNSFLGMLSSYSYDGTSPPNAVENAMLLTDLWIDMYDASGSYSVGFGGQREKLWAVALCVMPLTVPAALDALGLIINVCVQAMSDARDGGTDVPSGGGFGVDDPYDEDFDEEFPGSGQSPQDTLSLDDKRQKLLFAKDQVMGNVNLRDALLQQLLRCKATFGVDPLKQVLQQVDAKVSAEMQISAADLGMQA